MGGWFWCFWVLHFFCCFSFFFSILHITYVQSFSVLARWGVGFPSGTLGRQVSLLAHFVDWDGWHLLKVFFNTGTASGTVSTVWHHCHVVMAEREDGRLCALCWHCFWFTANADEDGWLARHCAATAWFNANADEDGAALLGTG